MALYHTYRPKTFLDVIGQEHITTTLSNSIRLGLLSHALLFYDPRGTGKTSMARIYAKAVNCTGNSVPCEKCESCQIFNTKSLDLIEIDAASTSGVDMVRSIIQDRVHFQPHSAKYKVYVIDEVHMLSTSAFNALLKTIEEPPSHCIFILVTTELHKLPMTVVSRCQLHQFRRISNKDIIDLLKMICEKEGFEYELSALVQIAASSGGCARDAVSLLDQLSVKKIDDQFVQDVLGLGDIQHVYNLAGCISDKNLAGILDILGDTTQSGVNLLKFSDVLIEYMHRYLLYSYGMDPGVGEGEVNEYKKLKLSTKEVVDVIELLVRAKADFQYIEPMTAIAMHLAKVLDIPTDTPQVTPQIIKKAEPPDPMKDPAVLYLLSLGFVPA